MNDFFSSIRALIEKVDLITLLLSLAISIFVFNVWIPHSLWAVFVFCVAYPCIAGVHKLIVYRYNEYKEKKYIAKQEIKKVKEEQEKEEQTKAHLCTIFESLPHDTKKGLIMLYQMPEPDGGFKNTRILTESNDNYQYILNAISIVGSRNINNPYVFRENMLNPSIYYIDVDFYRVLEEKSKTFEK